MARICARVVFGWGCSYVLILGGVRFFWFGCRVGVVGLIVLFVLVNRVGGVLDLWDLLVRVIALVICFGYFGFGFGLGCWCLWF